METQRFQPSRKAAGRGRGTAKLDADGLWDFALRALSQRPHSCAELESKLKRRAQESSAVALTLDKLREYGLTDDRKFSENFASSRVEGQGYGPARVLRDLRSRRVGASIAAEAVAQTYAGKDENELAAQFLLRRYRGTDLPTFLAEDKNLASAYRRLRTAGFSNSVSLRVLKEYRRSVSEWEDSPDEEAAEGDTV